jgi:hypothetical protein
MYLGVVYSLMYLTVSNYGLRSVSRSERFDCTVHIRFANGSERFSLKQEVVQGAGSFTNTVGINSR